MTKPEVIIIYRTSFQRVISWISAMGTFIALIGIGIALDSTALQWVGALIGFLVIYVVGTKSNKEYSIADARKRLDELEAQT